MKLHLWDGRSGRTWCGRGHSPGLAVARVRDVKPGKLVEHCADDLPQIVCGGCKRGMDRRIPRGWWWRRTGCGKWLALRLIPAEGR